MKAKFDKFILWEPDAYELGRGHVIAAPKGEYYVTQHTGIHFTTTRVFDSKGKFIRSK